MKSTSGKELNKELFLQSFFDKKRKKLEVVIEEPVEFDEKKALELEIVTLKD